MTLAWCDAEGWLTESRGVITPCFTQSIFAMGPVLFLAVAGPPQLVFLRASKHTGMFLVDTRKRLEDPVGWLKMTLSFIMALAPLVSIITALAMHATDQYSVAFFLSNVLRSVFWGFSMVLLWAEIKSQELTYNSWVLLSWWLLSLISNSFALVTVKGFPSDDPAILTSSIITTVEFFCSVVLVILGFFAPKSLHDTGENIGLLDHHADHGETAAVVRESSSSSNKWLPDVSGWLAVSRRSLTGRRYSQLNENLVAPVVVVDDTESAPPVLGTPSVVARMHEGGQHTHSDFFTSFLRSHAAFAPPAVTVPEPRSMDDHQPPAVATPLLHARSRTGSMDMTRRSLHAVLVSGSDRNMKAPAVYTVSIPCWLLLDAQGNVCDIESLVQGELYGDEVVDVAAAAAAAGMRVREEDKSQGQEPQLERKLSGTESSMEGQSRMSRSPSITNMRDRKVAFEIVVKCEEAEDDEEEEEEEEERVKETRLPPKWSVIRTYEEFDALYDALCARYGVEACTSFRPPVKKLTNGALRVADVSADMRAYGAFLRAVIHAHMTCPEFVEFIKFLPEEHDADEDEEEEELVLGRRADVGEEEMKGGQRRPAVLLATSPPARYTKHPPFPSPTHAQPALSAEEATAQEARDAELRQMVCRLRRAVPLGEHQIRLRTFYGVISGTEIARWLVDERECSSRAEAIELATQLVARGLLVPVVTGYDNDPPEDGETPYFSDSRLWLFRYGDRGSRDPYREEDSSQVSMLQMEVNAVIPKWVQASTSSASQSSQDMHITYEIVVSTPHEAWGVARRYRDFTQLQKRMKRLGIVPPESIPSKRVLLPNKDDNFLEERRVGLERYLKAVISAAQESPLVLGKTCIHFLDPDADALSIGVMNTGGTAVLDEDEDTAQVHGE